MHKVRKDSGAIQITFPLFNFPHQQNPAGFIFKGQTKTERLSDDTLS
jgi:hypothetical protein